jgi:hypothetical protein
MNSSPDDVTQASLVHKKLELGNKRQQKIEGILLRSRADFALWVRTDAMYIFFHQDNMCAKDLELQKLQ